MTFIKGIVKFTTASALSVSTIYLLSLLTHNTAVFILSAIFVPMFYAYIFYEKEIRK